MRVLSERGIVKGQQVRLEFDLLPAVRSVFEYSDEVSLCQLPGLPLRERLFKDLAFEALLGMVHKFDVGVLQ